MQTGRGNSGRVGTSLGRSGFSAQAMGFDRRGRRGFTLAELMVAVAVLLILLTMVGWIFSTATRASGTATGNNEIMGGARAAEGKLLQDFNGLLKSGFIGIWYQLTPDPRDTSVPPRRYVRTDRMVFYTTGDHNTIRQMRDPKPVSTWGNVVKISPLNPSAPNTNTYQPITGSLARVFLGHSFATDPSNPKANSDPLTWMLARQARVISPELGSSSTVNVNGALQSIANNLKYSDACEFELQMPAQWNTLWQSLGVSAALDTIFTGTTAVPWMSEGQGAPYWQSTVTAGMACCGWMRRPTIDPTTSNYPGTHMLFLPGCAEFKIQRWIERSPWTGAALGPNSASGMPRWWPEEDIDGNGVPNSPATTSDFQGAPDPANIHEYYNGPVPQPPTAAGWGGWSPYYPNTASPGPSAWFYRAEQDLPKAIKITVRLFDPNKRVADGQVLTMTFGMTGE